ncbi:N-acetyltransferase [Pseudomonas sp. NCCP-436]|uniref:N-acetyltransferase n=1 Tax=Pseudomonas sp. NCCP-436 TaxID=2842481 RepID=UPI001C7E6776|nr:N-acetyltransferase [Pseudomonas sp. NCCP-436]GIZ10721.1 acetyltransferase [Pseudomonas sp. NCCP-436]
MLIRPTTEHDTDTILDLWLQASIKAHDFIDETFWLGQLEAMRNLYLPSAEVYVGEQNHEVKGFYALVGERLAALFVSPEAQGRGYGGQLLEHAKARCTPLSLTVYQRNQPSVEFYRRRGFVVIARQLDAATAEAEYLMRYDA